MGNQQLVSVGIPTYNRPEGLHRTLECITKQTYKNLEILVADNCSPDPHVERIVKKYLKKDKRIQYFRHEKNFGAHYNGKFVLEKATGVFFMWAADDDEWECEFIEKNVRNLLRNENAVLSMSKVYLVGVDNSDSLFTGTIDIQGNNFLERAKTYLTFPCPSYNSRFYGVMKRVAILKSFIDYPFHGGDWAIMLKMLEQGDFIEVNEVLMYRSTGGISESFCKLLNYYNITGIKQFFSLFDLNVFIIKRYGLFFYLKIFRTINKWNKHFLRMTFQEYKKGNIRLSKKAYLDKNTENI